MKHQRLELRLPDWLENCIPSIVGDCPTVEERMSLVIELSRLNTLHGTGGPFAAGVFSRKTGRLVAAGVNLVVYTGCSLFHAEVVALVLAQREVRHYDLGSEGMPPFELVASTAPCSMCLGALCWSGVRYLACGARDEDARAIGFDEGPKPPDWVQALEIRGIAVQQDIHRSQAVEVLQRYSSDGGLIYNARQGVA
jgi:tRNA(Arg) A34 adenosine deaminase TadA